MAAELRDSFGVESRLIAGSNGIFDVIVDDKIVFSKFKTGRFPEHDEIIQRIKEL